MSQTKQTPKLYIAGMGMITPVGGNVTMTAAAINAGISAYGLSDYDTNSDEPITMAKVPNSVFEQMECDIIQTDIFNNRYERMIRMTIIALRECLLKHKTEDAIPFLLAMPEGNLGEEEYTPIIPSLANNFTPWINAAISRRFCTGRAAGMETVDFAFNYLMDQPQDYTLVAGVDSFEDDAVLAKYSGRLLSPGTTDAFAPGEGASALLLTRHIELAERRNGYVIALHQPGMADEPGHLFSETPYRGEGLDSAFKKALANQPEHSIHSIYSCMNGENHWAKEYGVAYLRNRNVFHDPVHIEHPADCYGDLGAASATSLIILAAEHLFKNKNATNHLVYSSADKAARGALVLEKILV